MGSSSIFQICYLIRERKIGNLHDFLNNSDNFPIEFSEAKSLIERMIQLNPKKRFSATEALLRPFFQTKDNLDSDYFAPLRFPENHLNEKKK
jgi:serine/threonine protein kinase